MPKRDHGRAASGTHITEELIEQLSAEAERGHDIDQIVQRRGGRPSMGSSAASVGSVRLDPELRSTLLERAEREHESTSSVIRAALRSYLHHA